MIIYSLIVRVKIESFRCYETIRLKKETCRFESKTKFAKVREDKIEIVENKEKNRWKLS